MVYQVNQIKTMSTTTQKIGSEIKFSSKLNHYESVHKGGGI